MSPKTVNIPDNLTPLFEKAEKVVGHYFSALHRQPASGEITISDSRYIWLRGASLSVEFFMLMRQLLRDQPPQSADTLSSSLLYELAHSMGKVDAQNFHARMGLTNGVEKLSAGPVHFAFAGWAKVDILADSRPVDNDEFVLIYKHLHPFEAEAWLESSKQPYFPICVMNAGYSAGWCEESFGMPLEAREIQCTAMDDDDCLFIMAPPHCIEARVNEYIEQHGLTAYRNERFASSETSLETTQGKKTLLDLEKQTFAYARQLESAEKELKHKIRELEQEVHERKIIEEKLTQLVNSDDLTGLASRAYFLQKVKANLEPDRRSSHGKKHALLFIDLDNFKHINDSLGHHIGDSLLLSVAKRLKAHTREENTLARLGGDEFGLWVSDIDHELLAGKVALNLIKALEVPFHIDGHEVVISPSIGIAVSPANGETADDLLKHADSAMYHAKASGKNKYHFFTEDLQEKAHHRVWLENELRKAIENNDFTLAYQPKVDIQRTRLIGLEALVRWHHAEQGDISPSEFIPVAEESGLIYRVGEAVIRQGCAQAKQWLEQDIYFGHIAINLSAHQFQQENLIEQIAGIAHHYQLPLHYLELEITEGTVMANLSQSLDHMHALKALGIQLAIDDFGTGYSSLNYLRRFPVDTLKIDKSFIEEMAIDPIALGLVESIISLAHNLDINVVAEGVETQQQLQQLRDIGCDQLQGYYLSKPLNAESLTQKLIEECHFCENDDDQPIRGND